MLPPNRKAWVPSPTMANWVRAAGTSAGAASAATGRQTPFGVGLGSNSHASFRTRFAASVPPCRTNRPEVMPFQAAAPAPTLAAGVPAGTAGASWVHVTFGVHGGGGTPALGGQVITPFQRSLFTPSVPVGPPDLRPPKTYKVLEFPLKSVVLTTVMPVRKPIDGPPAAPPAPTAQFPSLQLVNVFDAGTVLEVKNWFGSPANMKQAELSLLVRLTP